MGYLTTITVHNDAMGEFEKDPLGFGKAILLGIHKANYSNKEEDVGCGSYANYISVQPSRHADDETVYLHSGNTVFQLNAYCPDFQELCHRRPKLVKSWLEKASKIIKDGAEYLKGVKPAV